MTNAVLLKDVGIRVRNVSMSGCLLESRIPLEVGAIGRLELEIEGARRIEWFRICRVHGGNELGGGCFGAEFLPLALAGSESLRGAVGRSRPGKWADGIPAMAGRSSGDSGKYPSDGAGGHVVTTARPQGAAQKSRDSTATVVDFARRDPGY